MTTHYSSMDEAFKANPTKVADWGYIKCSEAQLATFGLQFFDDVDDPGPCRRSAFLGKNGALFILTIDNHSKADAAIFASNEKIINDGDLLRFLPQEYSRIVSEFGVIYFGIPT
ncbi:hypothetical protein [Burkholderia pyrrocinia]|uniref:hypothetical protein n=1 Tax=Burkholderia pyrrocinia TaxID=60550 RepID=UPI00158A9200|nr:hypothetical protein [Burkholderia pyrrocinia]